MYLFMADLGLTVAYGLFLVVVSRGYSSLSYTGPQCGDFFCCGAGLETEGPIVVAHSHLVAPHHVGSLPG